MWSTPRNGSFTQRWSSVGSRFCSGASQSQHELRYWICLCCHQPYVVYCLALLFLLCYVIVGEFQRVVPGDKPMGGHYPRFLNDVSVASSTGRIYMSDSSVKWRRSEFYILGLETNPDGRWALNAEYNIA